MKTRLIIFIILSPLLGLSQITSTQYYNWKKGAIFGDTVKVDGMGNSATWDSTYQVIRSLSWGNRRDTLLLSGATFYSGGGDDEGTYAGDYSFYLGQDAGKDASHATYSVNTGTGYAAMQDFQGTYSTAFGGGSLRNSNGQTGFFNPTTPPSESGGISSAFGGSAGRDIPLLNNSVFVGESTGRAIPYSFRNVLVGASAGTNYGSGYAPQPIAASVLLGCNSGYGLQGEQRNLIAIGFESALWANTGNRNIGIGTYSLFRRPANGGFQGNDVIHIGHRTSDRDDGAFIYPIVPPTDLENLDSNIVVGNNIIPNGEKTINFPDWSLYLGTENKSFQWDSAYAVVSSGVVSSADLSSYSLQDAVNAGGTAQLFSSNIELESTDDVIIGNRSDFNNDGNVAFVRATGGAREVELSAPTILLNGTVSSIEVGTDIQLPNANSFVYHGNPTTNGTFRMGRNGTGDFVLEVRSGGSWVTLETWTAP